MRKINFLTVETFAAWCAAATREGLAFEAHETAHAGFYVLVTGY